MSIEITPWDLAEVFRKQVDRLATMERAYKQDYSKEKELLTKIADALII